MERDDLRTALGDLAAHVEDADVDVLSVVRDRGRRRRRLRAGAITSVTSALLVVIVLIGVAIAGHDQVSNGVATGPAPSSTPTTASAVCTVADLRSRGLAPMPSAARVTRTEFSSAAELEPPAPDGGPVRVGPASVWQRAKVAQTPTTSYQLLLAVFTGPYPSATPRPQVNQVLSWVVVRRHYPVDVRARSFVPLLGTTSVTPPPCYFGTRYDVYSAGTGALLTTTVTDG